VSKDKIERPLKLAVAPIAALPAPAVLAAPANQPAMVDRGKWDIELPVKAALVRVTAPTPAAAPVVASSDNPKVEPGKVRWHKDLETACAASRTSGKPVLVFHMMGKLDDRFC